MAAIIEKLSLLTAREGPVQKDLFVSAIIKLIAWLPNGTLRSWLILNSIRVPGIKRIEVEYRVGGNPLVLKMFTTTQVHRQAMDESIFHFNAMLGWHLGLHRTDLERDDIRVQLGKHIFRRELEPMMFDGITIR